MYPVIEYATDTIRTIASLVFSGTAARYPDIRWIFSHGGGAMPFLLSRFAHEERTVKNREQCLPKGVVHELQKFYYDTAQASQPYAMASTRKVLPVSQLLFGTDFPYRTSKEHALGLLTCGFNETELPAIERGNAKRLIPSLPVQGRIEKSNQQA